MDYIGGVVRVSWITKPFILISQMKIQVIDHSWNIVPYAHFPFNLFLLNCNWRHIQRCRKHGNFAEKSLSEEFWAKYFQNCSTLFSEIWTHLLIVVMFYKNLFLFLFPLLSLCFIIPLNPKFMYFAMKNWTS
jgi:hypothetical protein